MENDAVSDNGRIASLSRMTRALKKCRTPFETLMTIRRGLGEAYGSTAIMLLSTRGLGAGEYRLLQLHLNSLDPSDDDPWARQQSPVRRGGVVASILQNPEPRIVNEVDWS